MNSWLKPQHLLVLVGICSGIILGCIGKLLVVWWLPKPRKHLQPQKGLIIFYPSLISQRVQVPSKEVLRPLFTPKSHSLEVLGPSGCGDRIKITRLVQHVPFHRGPLFLTEQLGSPSAIQAETKKLASFPMATPSSVSPLNSVLFGFTQERQLVPGPPVTGRPGSQFDL